MSLRINNNIASINGQRNLLRNDMMVGRSLEKLSSGLRINRAADDAAGLVISEQMRAQITGLSQAIDNSETGVSMIQTAEGALDEINSLMNKARELVLHAANEGANDTNQLIADQDELDNVINSISRIADFTQFGTKKLLDGSLNGATSLSAGVERVEVGNLANNAAISTGNIQMTVTGYTQEANVLVSGGAETSGRIFSANVTGMDLGSANVLTGVVASLTISGTVVATVNVGTTTGATGGGGINKDTLASLFNSQVGDGFTVVYDNTNNGFSVTRNDNAPVSTDFAAQVNFFRAGVALSQGTGGTVTSNIGLTAGTAANAAAVLFSGSSVATLSAATTASVLDSGTSFSYVLGDSMGGTYSGTLAASATGRTLGQALALIQADLIANGSGATGVNFTTSGSQLNFLGATSSGFGVSLELGDDTVSENFNFSLNVDYANAPSSNGESRQSLALAGLNTGPNPTFVTGVSTTGGVASLAGVTGASVSLATGAAMTVTVNGQSVTIVGSGSGGLSGLTNAIETALNALTGIAGSGAYQVAFGTGGQLSGMAGFNGSEFAGDGLVTDGAIVIGNTRGVDFDFQVTIDQASGTDLNFIDTEIDDGSAQAGTFNLATTSQNYASNTATVAAVAAENHNSQGTVNTNGSAGSIVLSTSSGGTVNLTQTNTTASGLATYTIATGGSISGVFDVSVELSNSLALSGGSASFTLNDGALFQIGANQAQRVGVAIRSVDASELGRNATNSGIINSLHDMLSTELSALTNGLYDESLAVLDAAIDEITTLRGNLGAFQSNTLESGLNSLRVSFENLTNAESIIRDVDFARESANFTANQIKIQASTAMLAQANQLPQNVLQLIGG